jgi:hypothetical protein
MFVEVFHLTIKGIHLALEVKISFGNSTPATDINSPNPVLGSRAFTLHLTVKGIYLTLKEILSRDSKRIGALGNKERSLNHFFGISDMKVGMITLLTPGLGSCLQLGENLQMDTSFKVGLALAPLLGKKDEG